MQGAPCEAACLRREGSVFRNEVSLIINDLAYFQDDASENNTGEIVKLSTQNLEVSKKICTFAPSNIRYYIPKYHKRNYKAEKFLQERGIGFIYYNCGTHPMPLLQ